MAVSRRKTQGPMPTVEWDGRIYSVRSRKIEIPDFTTMSRFAALQWLIANTYARGYSRPSWISSRSAIPSRLFREIAFTRPTAWPTCRAPARHRNKGSGTWTI